MNMHIGGSETDTITKKIAEQANRLLVFRYVLRDFTVIGAILDRGQKSERKQYGADLMKAQFEECKIVKYRFYFVINLYFN